MNRPHGGALLVVAFCASLGARTTTAGEAADAFEAKIRPVLIGSCFRCHGDTKTSGSLRVDSREALLKGGKSGPAIVPGNPDESLLIQAVQRSEDVSAMPPDQEKALRADQVADFVAWVKAGAVWPQQSAKFVASKHWAYEPIRDAKPPEILDKSWPQSSIDAFVLARQEAASVHAAPPADRLTLLRRATYDLTGLPPTVAEVDAFLQDPLPSAFDRVIDRLLASIAYGERWGQHWLDVVRYADTAGETADYPVPLAWRYRNYVIDAFNADKPYDQFLREQIAGDVIADREPSGRYAELIAATGYLAISRRFGFDSENYHHLTIQDTIDTLGQSVLGLSVGCARCHDHKFDPLSTRDYYALYGIFDSSRYAFPGSEQKQRVRSMSPLVPPSESQAKWRAHQARLVSLAMTLSQRKQPVPSALLCSLHDFDGDFEFQAPASGGSNGVLVQPWHYRGPVAVTASAQSPYKNVYAGGRNGASIAAEAGDYSITQAIYPRRASGVLHVNLDFRVPVANADAKGQHRFSLGPISGAPIVDVLIGADRVSLQIGETVETLAPFKPNEWQNLQLTVDLNVRTISGRVGMPGALTDLSSRPLSGNANSAIELIEFRSIGTEKRPPIEFDNLGIQDTPISPVSTEPPPMVRDANALDYAALSERLNRLTAMDDDLEWQSKDAPPSGAWNPGPNSVVKLSTGSQSPFQNIFPAGELGLSSPNRGEYDGFGQDLSKRINDNDRPLYVGFDFRCASQAAGGDGSWRYYVGHGPGNSAAIELYFNGSTFYQRSGSAIKTVSPLVIGEWYQVQLALDPHTRTYTGRLVSRQSHTDFSGEFANGWDGKIDYRFIDSYGHLGGIRPALDADNFAISDKPLPSLDAPAVTSASSDREALRAQVSELRKQLETESDSARIELERGLIDGPFAMSYGVVEGTPHNARIQLRGEPDQPGEEVPRGFLKVLGGGSLPPETLGSGRLELAQWLTRADNPLTARVMANRIWQFHFGRGLVKTPNDFGVRGLPPTHPELLDHLAHRFIQSGWSVKAMHRLIMRSAVYQQAHLSDPTDLYVSFARRRLSAEEIRDAILAVSGELDRSVGREHAFPSPIEWGFSQHAPYSAVYHHDRRGIYLMRQRLKRHPFLALFDGADPNTTTAERLTTTVPTQALYFLNDPFVSRKSETWAARILSARTEDRERIELAWQVGFGRLPTQVERDEATEFLGAYRAELASLKLDQVDLRSFAAYLRTLIGSNEFLHVD